MNKLKIDSVRHSQKQFYSNFIVFHFTFHMPGYSGSWIIVVKNGKHSFPIAV